MTTEQKNGYRIRMRKGAAGAEAESLRRQVMAAPTPSAIPFKGGSSQPGTGLEAQSLGIGGLGLYSTPRSTGQSDFYRPRMWTGIGTRELINPFDWMELLMFSRQLFARRPNLAAAVVQKNLYAVGDAWKPHYSGDYEDWGKAAEEWLLNVWYPNCDVRGGVFDFTTNLFLSGVAFDVDGDDVCVFAVDENGFPKLKFYPADCIGNRGFRNNQFIEGGPYDGARMCNGIVVDRDYRVLAVNVLGMNADDDELIPAYNCQLLYEPEWRSTARGIPRAAKACMDWFDVEDIDTFLKRGVKLDASIGLMHWTETGEAPTNVDIIDGRADAVTGDAGTDIKSEYRMGGEMLYMQAGKGEHLEALKSDRPHPNSEAFIARLERRGFLSVGWFYELIDPSAIGGAPVRMIQDEARHSVCARQRSLKRRALRAVGFALSQAMRIGQVPPNNNGSDFLKWDFSLPQQITVDNGYDEDSDRKNLLIGSTTLAAVTGKKGGYWKDNRKQRTSENKNLIECAIELVEYAKSRGQELSFTQALDMMSMASQNERRPQDEQQQEQPAEPGKKKQ